MCFPTGTQFSLLLHRYLKYTRVEVNRSNVRFLFIVSKSLMKTFFYLETYFSKVSKEVCILASIHSINHKMTTVIYRKKVSNSLDQINGNL